MAHYLSVPDAYPPHLTSLLADFLANTSPKDAEKAIVELFTGSGGFLSEFDPEGSWNKAVLGGHCRRLHRRNVVDDGFFSEMAAEARLLSLLDIPEVMPVDPDVIPTRAVPFSKLGYAMPGDVGVFHEKDPMFADYLVYREMRDEAWSKVNLFASADCSLYTDMPFCLQIANTYMNRLTAHDLQKAGRLHAPLCRWGDWKSYEPYITDVPLAFIGLPKYSALWVGSYGVSKKHEDKLNFKRGLEAMLEWLHPIRVFVYGAMPKDVFGDFEGMTDFVRYANWTTMRHEEVSRGKLD
ncbi:MAG: DUF4417 domain-containing protein [Eggerthellales bacterium]|nr:DUF4417 domain-containing protein [Eggerthellales bacterium]